jgi:hypothetical protein
VEFNDIKYIEIQEKFYTDNYNLEALQDSTDFNSFISLLPLYKENDLVMHTLCQFKRKAGLSRNMSNNFLRLIETFKPEISVPKDIRVCSRFIEKHMKDLKANIIKKKIPWPAHFCMDKYCNSHIKIYEIELQCLDLLELIAYKLIDPTLIFLYRDHIKWFSESEKLQNGSSCCSHFMTSLYANHTESRIKMEHSDGILIPIILYWDDVALGLRSNVSIYYLK